MLNHKIRYFCLLLLALPTLMFAEAPVFPITTTTGNGNQIQVSDYGVRGIVYNVKNNSGSSRRLTTSLPAGITASSITANACRPPFVLAHGASCELGLQINGASLTQALNLLVCQANGDGTLNPFLCSKPTTNNQLNVFRTLPYVYVTNANDATPYPVTKCRYTAQGVLGDCEDSGASYASFEDVDSIVLNANGHKAYIANNTSSNVSEIILCDVLGSSGSLANCKDSGATDLDLSGGSIQTVTLNPAGTKIYATVRSNSADSKCTVCDVDATTSLLSNCQSAYDAAVGADIPGIRDVAFNPLGTVAYIVGNGSATAPLLSGYYQCDVVTETGLFENCARYDTAFEEGGDLPQGFSITVDRSNQYAYAGLTNDTVVRCIVDPATANLVSCTVTGGTIDAPTHFSINASNQSLLVSANGTNQVLYCLIDGNNGMLSCSDSGADNITTPKGIAIL